MKTKRSLLNLIFWILLAIIFNIYIYYLRGEKAAVEFLGGYIIEMSLSLDNLFLFLMIFESFGIPEAYQERVLKYGVLGAIILRLIFILLGVAIVNKFHFIIYFFGILLFFSGFKMILDRHSNMNFSNNPIIRLVGKIVPLTNTFHGDCFFVKINKIIYATPLFIILLIIESSDIIFALDSIPAIFSITTDIFLVYTSNIFAILGLRSMYYILARMNSMFKFMKYGVACILMFTGFKLMIMYFGIEISVVISVLIIMIILLSSILISLVFDDKNIKKHRYIRK
ncbi:TerC/Alx family metal homeostasis membrane protein [Clostridium septicum]|uniref:Tellurium resistance protein TerC n=1 Tax=Clostridium septicum TaxID=1504 RepID=A0A9N7JIM4_CLOSE|nr:TerC/Alx family metal homeostasis membrane protein [Clostridium septicum]AYE33004.1 tellurium resistance protein TerC [Clostridium septicum]QAS61172.1 TerC/Alx family metal homeostasis membrane protein [Clostridium septicum]UEC19480.1 TerC/Alx family metal homeostasis membrane protein [Clostridium septicum]USR99567.1 TerC/Alx family metal homeostasis membrane protein [Clostridium septicum]WLF68077.1 TerC/Alx family metal homeostasis membrane protein [Clostridium septicum]